eukprot:50772_1
MTAAQESSALSSVVDLYIKCSNLRSLDAFSKSDPFAVVSVKDCRSGHLVEVGRTESIKNSNDPQFKTQISMQYYFEEQQEIRVDLYDQDSKSKKLSAHDHVGFVETNLGNLVAAIGQQLSTSLLDPRSRKPIRSNHKPSTITVVCEERKGSQQDFILNLGASNLHAMDFFGDSDPYLQIYRQRPDGSWLLVYQTNTIKDTLTPRWKEFRISSHKLTGSNPNTKLMFKCFDWNCNIDDDLIGEAYVTQGDLLKRGNQISLVRFSNPTRKRDRTYGCIDVLNVRVEQTHSFLEYLSGGCQVSLMVAIDYTGSNGHPSDSRSLHFINLESPNEYIRAISSIGNVVAPYDSDQRYPVWGFGAKIGSQTSHCFSVTFDENNPEVGGVDGIVNAYKASFAKLQLSGPTYFHQIIQTAAAVASQEWSPIGQNYYVVDFDRRSYQRYATNYRCNRVRQSAPPLDHRRWSRKRRFQPNGILGR